MDRKNTANRDELCSVASTIAYTGISIIHDCYTRMHVQDRSLRPAQAVPHSANGHFPLSAKFPVRNCIIVPHA